MGGGVGGVRAGRVVDGTLALRTVASGSSEGVERRKWPTAARVSEFGTAAGNLYLLFFWSIGRQEQHGRQSFSFGSYRTAWAALSVSEARCAVAAERALNSSGNNANGR